MFHEPDDSAYTKYWMGVFSMDRENVLGTLLADDLRRLSSEDLCKLFRFLSCFFCCLARFDADDDSSPCSKIKPCGE